ncbi:MAG: lipid-A-disaccharide synthase [Candidatus Eremiobacteraeota bacterium]|nr:lipid-A-disaccharide synthase [Candidatus Eremiobacteraeota bacterium]
MSGHLDERKYKFMVIAGEASADLQASALGKKMKELVPNLELMGIGGPRMKDTGYRLFYDSSTWSAIGVIEGLVHAPEFIWIMKGIRKAIIDESPDLLVFIDSPAINMRLARFAGKHNIRTIYYFPPSAWTKSIKRAKSIAERVDHVIATFSFTADFYKKYGIPVEYFGHPLLDLVEEVSPEEAITRLGLEKSIPYLGILPGSRLQEVRTLLPVILDACKRLREKIRDLEFLLPIALPVLNRWIEPLVMASGLPIHLFQEKNFEVMQASRALLTASGSATLEGAIMKKPMTVIYRINIIDWYLANLLFDSKYVALPNIILDSEVVPELIQDQMTVTNITDEVYSQLTDSSRRQEIITGLEKIRKFLGHPGVIDRVANYMARLIINDRR